MKASISYNNFSDPYISYSCLYCIFDVERINKCRRKEVTAVLNREILHDVKEICFNIALLDTSYLCQLREYLHGHKLRSSRRVYHYLNKVVYLYFLPEWRGVLNSMEFLSI